MEMVAAGIALWAMGSLLLGLVWIAAVQVWERRTAQCRPSVLLPTPRTECVDLAEPADDEPSVSLAVPQPAQ